MAKRDAKLRKSDLSATKNNVKDEFDGIFSEDIIKPISKKEKVQIKCAIDLYGLNLKQQEFIKLLIPMSFHITNICCEVGITRKAYYEWLTDNKQFAEAVDQSREYITEIAEACIIQAAKNMDKDASKFLLTKLNNKYKDKIDITTNGESINKIDFNLITKNINNNGEDTIG